MTAYFELEMVIRLVLAALLGGLIGAERERRLNGAAELRTHSLVSVAIANSFVRTVKLACQARYRRPTFVAGYLINYPKPAC